MISRLAAFIVAFVIAATCQTTQPSFPGANRFYWSEAKAHELDYKRTIATAKELSPKQRGDLLAFVLSRFQHQTNAKGGAMFEDIIEFVDLNDDGTTEIIAQGYGLGPCGATGNCIVMVLQSTSSGWTTLLDTYTQFGGGFEKIRVLDNSMNGYRDIVIADHDSACERTALVLAYDGKQYRERDCYHINWCTEAGTVRLSKPEIGACAK
jgi:hypothetical protein